MTARRGFGRWYRRYYLLVNVPLLFALLELVLVHVDLVHRWPFDDKDDLTKAFTTYGAHPPPAAAPVLLLLGNSATDRAFDAPTIESALADTPARDLRVYNFGLKGSRIDDMFEFVDLIEARGIHPTYVVLGVNPYLIDYEVNVDSLYPWLERRTPYLYFHRSRIRTKMWFWLSKVVLGHKKETPADRVDEVADPTARIPAKAIPDFLTEFEHRPADDYPLLERVPEFVSWLESKGIRAYVVIMPMADVGTSRLDTYPELIGAIRDHVPAGSLDLSKMPDKFPNEVFSDVAHPNKAGRAVMTQELITWLRTLNLR